MSCVTCHVSHVTCHMSHFTCHMSRFTNIISYTVVLIISPATNFNYQCKRVKLALGGSSVNEATFLVLLNWVLNQTLNILVVPIISYQINLKPMLKYATTCLDISGQNLKNVKLIGPSTLDTDTVHCWVDQSYHLDHFKTNSLKLDGVALQTF